MERSAGQQNALKALSPGWRKLICALLASRAHHLLTATQGPIAGGHPAPRLPTTGLIADGQWDDLEGEAWQDCMMDCGPGVRTADKVSSQALQPPTIPPQQA